MNIWSMPPKSHRPMTFELKKPVNVMTLAVMTRPRPGM